QYTDITEVQKNNIEAILPNATFQEFRSSYIETAKKFQEQRQKEGENAPEEIQQLDFEFVLFASAVIDYDYIMNLIADSTQQKPSKQKMTKVQVISLLKSHSNLMDEEEDLSDFIDQLDWSKGYTTEELKEKFETYKVEKYDKELADIAHQHGLQTTALKTFVEKIMNRMIFDGEKLTDLMEPLELGWKQRSKAETALMGDLVPLLKKQAGDREISGLAAYE